MKVDVSKLLYEILEDDRVYDENFDLIKNELLDSLLYIELFTSLEDNGVILYPTRIDRECLRTPKSIQKLVDDYINNNSIS